MCLSGIKTGVNIACTFKTSRKHNWSVGLNKNVTVNSDQASYIVNVKLLAASRSASYVTSLNSSDIKNKILASNKFF